MNREFAPIDFLSGLIDLLHYCSLMAEYVYDAKLRQAMNLDQGKSSAATVTTKSNPDDDLF